MSTIFSNIPKIKFTDSQNFVLIAGPCAIEGEKMAMEIAETIHSITQELKIPYIFKGSFKKANRSRLDSFTGIGDQAALEILQKVGSTYDLPTTTDIHEPYQAALAAQYVEVLQIPAFLVRQTDLVVAAAETQRFVTLKKAQFMAPEAMQFAVQKVKDSGNTTYAVIERGNSFGYKDLVVDFTGIPIMQHFAEVILDVTHSTQKPNQSSGVTSGKPEMIETLAKAGIASGVQGIFLETHPNPSQAKSDGANMLPLDQLKPLLEKLLRIQEALKK